MAEEKEKISFELGMKWLPDYPEFRDYTVDKGEVATRLVRPGQKDSVKAILTTLMGNVLTEGVGKVLDIYSWVSMCSRLVYSKCRCWTL